MKKIILPVLFVIAFFTLGFIQSGVTYINFKVYIKPNCIYTQVSKNHSCSTITFIGTQQYLDEMKAKGVANPSIKKDSNENTVLLATGTMKLNRFPVTINTDNPYIAGTGNADQDKITLFGACNVGNMPTIDSLSSKTRLDSSIKVNLIQSLETSLSRLALPEQRIKLHESFNKTEPIKMPMGNKTMEVQLTTTYRLTGIDKDMATFTTTEVYVAKMDDSNKESTLGRGKGKFTFDMKKNYYVTYQTTDTLHLHVKYNDNLSMEIKSVNGYNMSTSIVAQR